ncbi:MAG: hypothetical protein A3J48_04630 [Candidatus Doudnabacteria bacterium RIFCSPHIGHO2_02_FULL_46_11]|uniref:Uncharacterized protein n=1 Tax=Candidatus Doudnabacteria bacterium RIFCSPHIGHO2_02_FULL_46_11 TaxID=1817832 RepID=A0A1F5P726_9BACT|nr:MAG: hypothetical protein A3J48_04630 [Candidatus Doudnabacteria bacterium RIFCSPHIGHO2_02_FULL_46_11]
MRIDYIEYLIKNYINSLQPSFKKKQIYGAALDKLSNFIALCLKSARFFFEYLEKQGLKVFQS